MSDKKNVPFFDDLYKSVNSVLDRSIRDYAPARNDKTFPGVRASATDADPSSVNLAYNLKTATGQKFKFSGSGKKVASGTSVTGKVAIENFVSDKDLGVSAGITAAKKDSRSTVQIDAKYTKIEDATISAYAKVDKGSEIGVTGQWANDMFSAKVDLSRGLDWRLFKGLETDSKKADAGQTDVTVSALSGWAECAYYAGFSASYGVLGSKGFQGAEAAVAFKEGDFQIAGFARFTGQGKTPASVYERTTGGLNAYVEFEKDVKFAGEIRVSPAKKTDAVAIEVGGSLPFEAGTLAWRFGTDSKLSGSYTQKLSDGAKISLGATLDADNLSNSAYSLGLTFDA